VSCETGMMVLLNVRRAARRPFSYPRRLTGIVLALSTARNV